MLAAALAGRSARADEVRETQRPDRVELHNGTVLSGFVVESGGNSIRVEIGGGSRDVLKRDVARIDFYSERSVETKLEHDRVEFKDGHKVDGKVEVIDGGRKVRVKLPRKAAKAGAGAADAAATPRKAPEATTVVFPMTSVLRIRFKDEPLSGGSIYYSKELEKRIDSAIAELLKPRDETGAGTEERDAALRDAEKFLIDCGALAIDRVRTALQELRPAAAPSAPPAGRTDGSGTAAPSTGAGASGAGATDPIASGAGADASALASLRAVVRMYEIKELMPQEIQDGYPDIYESLSHRSAPARREELLKVVLPSHPESGVPLALYVIKDPGESESVRGVVVDILRRLNLNQALVNLYNESDGQLKFVAAIALARNRVLLGVPTIIEALSLESEALRQLADQTLRQATGKDFSFFASGTPAARARAIAGWKKWWQDNQAEIEKTAILVLRGGSEESAEWKQSTKLWKQAHEAWDRKEIDKALKLLQSAVACEPNHIKAQLSLAVLHYTERKDFPAARKLLEQLLERPFLSITDSDAYRIRLELANVTSLEKNFVKARELYDECLGFEPDSLAATIGKAECQWLLATDRTELSAADRQKELAAALQGYQRARELAEAAVGKLTVLKADEIIDVEALPFARRDHNRGVLDTRRRMELEVTRLYLDIARVHSVGGKYDLAAESVQRGLDYLGLTPQEADTKLVEAELRNYLAITFERQGKDLEAIGEYRRVLRQLDAENRTSLEGLDRLRKKAASVGK